MSFRLKDISNLTEQDITSHLPGSTGIGRSAANAVHSFFVGP
jgi:hypothetical protein